MKTRSKVIEVLPHYDDRTFTIKMNSRSIYETYPMSREEFESALKWTKNEWKEYLGIDEYYVL